MKMPVNEMIVSHINQLEEQLTVLHSEMVPLVQEIRRSLKALSAMGVVQKVGPAYESLCSVPEILVKTKESAPSSIPVQRMTLKELAQHALQNEFPEGASAAQLLDLFVKKWSRTDIIRTSLSATLSRLKIEGKVSFEDGIWTNVIK